MNKKKTFTAAGMAAAIMLTFPTAGAFADSAEGDEIVTLGEDLTTEQRDQLLNEMDADAQVETITVSNEEEHEYLGDYMSARDIGTRALSSAKITTAGSGDGIDVETNNITKISESMYANAMITAGVEDAEVYVTAPMEVSGTGALTGILKAYEVQNDVSIPEEQKQVANEEVVKTAELGESIGTEEATELITRVKQEISEQNIESSEDIRVLIQNIAVDMNIELTQEQTDGLVSLFDRMKDLNVDWGQVQDQISKVQDNIGSFVNSDETQSFFASFLDFINGIIDSIFGGSSESESNS